jgi:uncharacterized protein
MSLFSPALAPIALLIASNLFMTTAWYGHLKFPQLTFPAAIAFGWGIAFFEYCLAVPANRIGYGIYSAGQLKAMQEVISILIFMAFSTFVLGEDISIKQIFGFALLALGAFLIFEG